MLNAPYGCYILKEKNQHKDIRVQRIILTDWVGTPNTEISKKAN